MQEYLVTDFKALFGQHGHGVGQMRCIDRLSRLSEKLLDNFSFGLVAFDGIAESAICAIGYSYDKKFIHGFIPYYALSSLSASDKDFLVQLTLGEMVAPLAMLAVAL